MGFSNGQSSRQYAGNERPQIGGQSYKYSGQLSEGLYQSNATMKSEIRFKQDLFQSASRLHQPKHVSSDFYHHEQCKTYKIRIKYHLFSKEKGIY